MRVEWSLLAIADREEVFDYIEAENPLAAVAVDEKIDAVAGRLKTFPLAGKAGRVEGTRELVIAGTTFIAVYAVQLDRVKVLRILHGARHWPDNGSI